MAINRWFLEADTSVYRIQLRITKAAQKKHWGKVKAL